MAKKWKSYHGADGVCTYTDAWLKCEGLVVLGHPSTFTISEIVAAHGQLTPDRLLHLLSTTTEEFKGCVVSISFTNNVLSMLELLQTEGKLKFERQRSQYSDRFRILEISAPAIPSVSAKDIIASPQKGRWWKLW